VRLEALPEGTVVHANCPVYQARATVAVAARCSLPADLHPLPLLRASDHS
jgi:hypothetical protein